MTSGPRPRVALVLGAGGSVGHAYHAGVLAALADELGWDARDAELIVGTSAGSVAGATLRAGLSPADIRCRAQGESLSVEGAGLVRRADAAVAAVRAAAERFADDEDEDDPVEEVVVDDAAEVAAAGGWAALLPRVPRIVRVPPVPRVPRVPRIQFASPERVGRALREPWNVTAGSLFSAMLPAGRRPTDHLRAPYDELLGSAWPASPLWIVAVDLDVGNRVVFKGDGGPAASVGQAVQASCAIPGYFAPAQIDGSRYVDGGVHSTTNADLVGELDPAPDVVVVSAPMAVVGGVPGRGPRFAMRQLASRWLAREVAALRAGGIEVVTFKPTADDVAAMSGDSMDPAKTPAVCLQATQSALARIRTQEIADRLAVLHP